MGPLKQCLKNIIKRVQQVLTHWDKGIFLCFPQELGLVLIIIKICRHPDCEDKDSN